MDKALLFESRLPKDTVPLDGLGVITVRGLSRDETLALRDITEGVVAVERAMIAAGCMDPLLTVEEVAVWQKAALSGELKAVSNKISELSGLSDGQDKRLYREFEDDPDAEFRDVPGEGTSDDRGPAPSGDVRG